MTDTPAHTPLPWAAQPLETGDDAGVSIIGSDLGGLVCASLPWPSEIDSGDYSRVESNAAFIVRACNSHYSLVEALREAIDAIEDDRGLDDYICCSGYMCGCQGSSKRQLMLHDLRAALSQAGGASE